LLLLFLRLFESLEILLDLGQGLTARRNLLVLLKLTDFAQNLSWGICDGSNCGV